MFVNVACVHHNNEYGIYITGINQIVSMDCLNWMGSDFTYPDHVTDVIIFHQCTSGQEETLEKVKFTKHECSLSFLEFN